MSSTFYRKVSLSRIREVNDLDTHRIYCGLDKARSRVVDRDIAKLSPAQYTTEQIVQGNVPALILDEAFLVVYNIGSPWYSTRVFLEELLVLRIGKGSSFDAVCDLLDDLAEEFQANDIIVGGALAKHPKALTRMYEARGYSLMTIPSLIKRR